MKVICIDNKPRPYSKNIEILNRINEGDAYEVYLESLGTGTDGTVLPVYYLVGINEKPKGLASDRFVEVSDLDETTLVNDEWEEKYFVPVNK